MPANRKAAKAKPSAKPSTRKPAAKTAKTPPGKPHLPGDRSAAARAARMIRVDQAGEYGAMRIYEGQLAVLRRRKSGPVIEGMAAAEEEHLRKFNQLMVDRRVRPTALSPLWHVAGFALGAGTALLGERAAMACTVAVEEEIEDHYARQAAALGEDDGELRQLIEDSAADEAAHREAALRHGAERAPGYPVLRRGIRAGTRLAIWLSERI